MAKYRYCVEHIIDGKFIYRMGDSKEVCMKYCEEKAKTMGEHESYMLFYARCDEDGKYAGGPREVIEVW